MIDQETEYRRLMGEEAYQRQIRLGKLARNACVCGGSRVSKRWADSGRISVRVVHKTDCPKWKEWMA